MRKMFVVLSLLLVTGLVLSACQPQVIEVEKEVVVTQVVEKEVEVDKVVEVEVETVVEVEKVVEVETFGEGFVDTSAYATGPPYTICFSNASVSNSWRVSMVEHVRYEIEQHPEIGTYIETDANDDAAKQISDTEDLLAQGCDVLIISPATADALTPVVDDAMAAGVPVVTLDRNVSGDNYVTFVESSNCEMGKQQAEWLAETMGGEGNIVMLSGIAGASPAEDRLTCAREVFAGYSGITELAQAYANWSPVEGKQIMENWLVTFDQVDGIWSDSGLQGSGAAEAFIEAGMDVPPVTGEDFNMYLKMWDNEGFDGLSISFPVRMGRVAVKVALDVLSGQPVPHYVDVPRTIVTNENLADYVRHDLPDDYWADSDPQVAARLFPGAAACSEDLSGKTITVHQQAGTEGPIASILGLAFQFATTQALAEINAAGGVCGAELAVKFRETAYDVEQEVVAYEEARAEDPKPFLINTYNSGATVALAERFTEDHIASIAAGVNTQAIYSPRDGWTVGIVPAYSDQFAGFGEWVVNNWAELKPEGAADDIVIGVIGWQGAYGSGATTDEAIAHIESLGATVLPLEQQEISPTYDSTGNVQALLAQGANVIYQQNLSFSSTNVIATVRALGVWDQVVLGGVNWSGNQDVLNFLGENAGLIEGYYTLIPYITWDEKHSGIDRAIAAFEASGAPANERTFSFIMTYAGWLNQARIIEHAINRDGWPVTGDTFMAAFKDLGTVDVLGIHQYNVVGQNRTPGMTRIGQFQTVDGNIQIVPITDWFELPRAWPAE